MSADEVFGTHRPAPRNQQRRHRRAHRRRRRQQDHRRRRLRQESRRRTHPGLITCQQASTPCRTVHTKRGRLMCKQRGRQHDAQRDYVEHLIRQTHTAQGRPLIRKPALNITAGGTYNRLCRGPHNRFGGRPRGKEPAPGGHLAARPTQWYTVNSHDLLRLVIVRDPAGIEPDDFFFTTDPLRRAMADRGVLP